MSVLAERIEALIAEGQFAPGDRLPAERQLAADLGVSRSQLREAIKHLSSRGLIVSQRGGGTYVTSPEAAEPVRSALQSLAPLATSDAGYWRDIMEIRLSLESDAAGFAASRAEPDDLARIEAAYGALSAGLGDPSAAPLSLAKLDAAFHQTIVRAAHNAVLFQVMTGLEALLEATISESIARLYRLPGVAADLDRQHLAILAAIRAGAADAARTAARDHLVFVAERLARLEEDAARHKRSTQALRQFTPSKGSET